MFCHKSEKPAHSVTIGHDLWVGRTEVTQAQYVAVMGSSPHSFPGCGDTCPVESVSWFDAVRFANALSEKEGLKACYIIEGDVVTWPDGVQCGGYRLPTEAEWEYAARAGQDLPYGHTETVNEAGWTVANSKGRPQPVATLAPNAWGIHDMVGNVWEWCFDWRGKYTRKAVVDPTGPDAPDKKDPRRVLRGGSWAMFTSVATVSTRNGHAPERADSNTGFRLVRTATEAASQ
jgi:formylglycine-generating enzyme required for sulfatase activity